MELLLKHPRLVSPCIDVPLASVQIERTDSLEMEEVVLRDQTDYYGYVAWGEYPHNFAAVLNQVITTVVAASNSTAIVQQ